jgi:hypothetical protein
MRDDLGLAQIAVQMYRDDQFFHELRLRYNELLGILRRCLSIWSYSHCDLVKVYKPDPRNMGRTDLGIF